MVHTSNSQHNHLYRVLQAPLQKPLQHDSWISFTLQNAKAAAMQLLK